MICTFIGHRNAPNEIKPTLKQVLVNLIEKENVNKFYVGNHGNFDCMVKDILKELKQIYPINYYVVLAYLPTKENHTDYSETIYLDELNCVPYKYRIVERNKQMIKKSDFVVVYVKHIGNTEMFKDFAEKLNKTVITI